MFLIVALIFQILCCDISYCSLKMRNTTFYNLDDHTIVSSSNVFPYMAAILHKTQYLCAGALIDENWVLTSADPVTVFRDSLRLLHVRLGSINNKKGGVLLPVKLIEFHPYFDEQKPEYDIALLKLAGLIRLTPNLNPIRLQRKPKEIMATHFIVTSWPKQQISSAEIRKVSSAESIQRRRMLRVAHLHPMKQKECGEEMEPLGFDQTQLMCLEQGVLTDPCSKEVGAPVVLNGILWGLVSSWVPDDCDLLPGPTFVTLVSPSNTSSWIHATMKGVKWHKWMRLETDYDDYDDDDD